MDDRDVVEAGELLARVLAAVERGDLEASPAEVAGLVGAIATLRTLRQSTD
ncbi:hypothetical protein GALL_341370 [mine drainage metagenome]|uniref:Uncharacterized protein n=1 Tax=mine drainage metagenome TaxID=410659 RepID=A0A1J5QKK0_9ZZZZ